MDSNALEGMRWCDTDVCLADIFKKPGSKLSNLLLEVLRTGKMVNLKFLRNIYKYQMERLPRRDSISRKLF